MDTFSPKVNLCPSWMCLMASTLGIPGESWPMETRSERFWTWLETPRRKKTSRKKLVSLELWNKWKQQDFYGFWRFVVFKMIYLHEISSICWLPCWLHCIIFVDLRWGMPSSASVLLQCQTLVPLPSELRIASWRRRHQTRWWGENPLKIRVFEDGPMTPNKNAKGKIVASELVCLFIFLKMVCFFAMWANPPHTHTRICKGYCLAQVLGELVEIDLQPYFNQFPDRNDFFPLDAFVPEWCDMWYWNLLRSIREQPLKNTETNQSNHIQISFIHVSSSKSNHFKSHQII